MNKHKLLGGISLLVVSGALMVQTRPVHAAETESHAVPSTLKASPMYGQGFANAALAGYVGGGVAGIAGLPGGMAAGAIGGMLGGGLLYILNGGHQQVVAPRPTELD